MQATNGAPSMAHSYVAPSSLENPNTAVAELTRSLGPESMVTTGAPVSTVKLRVASPPALPAASTAMTRNVCGPSATPRYALGDVQLAKAPPSNAHWSAAPISLENSNEAVVELTSPLGPESIVAIGPTVSTVKL